MEYLIRLAIHILESIVSIIHVAKRKNALTVDQVLKKMLN